jgi:transcriptional regulator with XRE-family HTH domain
MESLCRNIRVIREIKGLSQEYMAMKLHMSQSAYAKIERTETRLTVDRLQSICVILEIDIPQLFREAQILNRLQRTNKTALSLPAKESPQYESKIDRLKDELLLLKEERKRLLRILEQVSRNHPE